MFERGLKASGVKNPIYAASFLWAVVYTNIMLLNQFPGCKLPGGCQSGCVGRAAGRWDLHCGACIKIWSFVRVLFQGCPCLSCLLDVKTSRRTNTDWYSYRQWRWCHSRYSCGKYTSKQLNWRTVCSITSLKFTLTQTEL